MDSVLLLMPEYLEVVSLFSLFWETLLEYLLMGVSELSLQLPYLVVVSVSLLNASLQLDLPPPLSNRDPPPSNLEVVPPPSVLAVLTGLLEYFGSEELESEEARLDLQPTELPPYLPALE